MVGIYSADKLGKRRLEIKKGMLRKKVIEKEYHIFEEVPESATLEEEKIYKRHLVERLKNREKDGVKIYNATDNTPHITHGYEREDLKNRPIMARDLQDAMKWNILFQLLTHIPALSGPDNLSSFHFAERNAKVLENFVEKTVFAKDKKFAMSELRENDIGGILISFDELKRNLVTLEAKRRMEEAVDKAIAAAEKIAERKVPYFDEFGKRKFKQVFESPEDIYKIPELVEFLKVVKEVVPKDVLKEPLSIPPRS
ncbi:hypothetical protein [Thermococcus sp.]|uniref:hypothetical protein n=1 Tax=Thermococcus sp. TaxID=35749 RepID=UPI0026259D00|nr:hypothetical protein [Thermococcus sp.]